MGHSFGPCLARNRLGGRGGCLPSTASSTPTAVTSRGDASAQTCPPPPPVVTPICCARPYAITGDRPRKSAFGFRGEENQLAPKVTPRGRAGGDGLAPRFRRSPRGVSIRHTHSVSHAFPRCDTASSSRPRRDVPSTARLNEGAKVESFA